MSKDLLDNELLHVLDATKIQTYMNCPRKFFFEYVLGWRYEMPNVHLEFGVAWHLAMEVLLSEGYTAEACAKAYVAFEQHYRKHFDATWDEGNGAKIPAVALDALPRYCNHWADDDFEVLHVEVSGSIGIAENKSLHFKTDTICRGSEGYFSLEHKTGTRFSSSWAAQWRQKMQVGTYAHVLYSLYPENEVYGVKINGAFLAKPAKLKKDGTPYANARTTEFHRIPVRHNLAAMNAWLMEAIEWYDDVYRDYDRLSESSESDSYLAAFKRNTESCTHYGQCPFLDYCSVWHNPLQHADTPPVGYKVEMWDPRSPEYAKEVMEL